MLSKFRVLPALKFSPCTPRFTQILPCSQHSPHPCLQISVYRPISPVQHCALYKKKHYVSMYKLLLGSLHASVRFLNTVCLLTVFGVCDCPYPSFFCRVLPLLHRSIHFVYIFFFIFSNRSFWSFATSLSFLDWAEAGTFAVQCRSCAILQITEYLVPAEIERVERSLVHCINLRDFLSLSVPLGMWV
jgi:hypothetical protein